MNKIMLIMMMIVFGCLAGCASDGNNATMVRGGTTGSAAATQSSAQNIAPITTYIGNVY